MILEVTRDIETEYREALSVCLDRYTVMAADHLDLMDFIYEFREGVTTLPLMKLNRWLGYIQGVLIERGATTVVEERDFTRPLFRHLDFG